VKVNYHYYYCYDCRSEVNHHIAVSEDRRHADSSVQTSLSGWFSQDLTFGQGAGRDFSGLFLDSRQLASESCLPIPAASLLG
jgi:hypothetical protein